MLESQRREHGIGHQIPVCPGLLAHVAKKYR